eukprot:gene31970-33897_t
MKPMEAHEIPDDVVKAVAACLADSDLVMVDSEGTMVKRKAAVKDEGIIASWVVGRSLFTKPFLMDTLFAFPPSNHKPTPVLKEDGVIAAEVDGRSLFAKPVPIITLFAFPPSNHKPTPEDGVIAAEVDGRSLFAKPFPMDASMDTLFDFFSKYAPVNCVRMRRVLSSKAFRGSIFIEFASTEDAEKVMATPLEFEGAPLRMEMKLPYIERKKAERKSKSTGPGPMDEDSNDELDDGVGGKIGDTPSAEILAAAATAAAKKEVVRKEEAAAAPSTSAPAAASKKRSFEEAKEGAADEEEGAEEEAAVAEPVEEKDPEYVTGCIVRFEVEEAFPVTLGPRVLVDALGCIVRFEGEEAFPETLGPQVLVDALGCIVRFEVEEAFPETLGPRVLVDALGGREVVRYAELDDDKKSGYLRYNEVSKAAEVVKEFLAKPEEERLIVGMKGSMRLSEGEEELAYYKRAATKALSAAAREGGRGGGRGGARGGGRGRGGGGRGGGGRG